MLNLTRYTKKLHLFIYCAVAIFYFWMAAQIPYTHDDWDWGLDIGLHQLIHATVNSRYVGNFFEVIMTRSEFIKTLIMGMGFWGIPFALSRIASRLNTGSTNSTQMCLFLICNCLLLTMNREMWRQTYGWVAGYANFGISALFMLPWMRALLNSCDSDTTINHDTAPILLLFFCLSLSSQLFLENLAIFHLLVSIYICCIQYCKTRRISPRYFIMLIGAVIGLFVMFSSSLYETLFSTGAAIDDYRQIPLLTGNGFNNGIYQIAISAIHLLNRLYSRNIILSLFVLSMLTILVLKNASHHSSRIIMISGNLILCLLLLIGFSYDVYIDIHQTNMYIFDALLSIGYFLMVLFEIFVLFRYDITIRSKLCLIWFVPIIIIAPLVITTEIGSRLFFTTNIFVILFSLILFKEAFRGKLTPCNKAIMVLIASITSFLLLFHGYIYWQIGDCKQERDRIIDIAIESNATEIILPSYPYSHYLHAPDPTGEIREEFFKRFYGISMDTKIIFAD